MMQEKSYIEFDFSTNESSGSDISTDNEDFDDEMSSIKTKNSGHQIKSSVSPKTTGKQHTVMQRRPTRKPDPNTYNRNALMARENRRKKKEYIESLEKEVHTYKMLNKQLQKIIKKQQKTIGTLKEEKKYFQSIIKNKTEICSLINAVQKNAHPLQQKENTSVINYRQQDSNLQGGQQEPVKANSKKTNLNHQAFHIKDDPHDYHSYLNTDEVDEFSNGWEKTLLNKSSPFSGDSLFEDLDVKSSGVEQDRIDGEHNYYDNRLEDDAKDITEVDEDAGVCIHVSGGKISLEMCPSCHKNSTQHTEGFIS